jgi:hypothetical protein
MPIDETQIGRLAAELMEELATQFGDDAEIERVALIVAVDHGEQTTVHWKFTPNTPTYIGRGLLEQVGRALG